MMKTIIKNIALLATLLVVGCNKSFDESASGEGLLSMSFEVNSSTSVTRADSDVSSILERGVLKIYNSSSELVRYYEDVTETITDYLAVGEYSIEFTTGATTYATFEADAASYYGQSGTVTVATNQTTEASIDVNMQNVVVSINLDDTSLAENYNDYSVVVYAANSVDDIISSSPSLLYDSSKDGYFVLPEGVDNLVWQFLDDGFVEASGIITSAQIAHQYKLSFKYSTSSYELDVTGLIIEFEEVDQYDDSIDFEIKPVVSGTDFVISEVQNYTESRSYSLTISAISEIEKVEVTVGSNVYEATILETKALDGDVTFDPSTNLLTIYSTVFDNITTGGVNEIEIKATDVNGIYSTIDMLVGIDGFAGLENEDMWKNTADFVWYTATPASSVTIQYRYKGETTWSSAYTATSEDGYTWSVANTPEWSQGTNDSDLPVYQLTRGIVPSKDYEFQAVVDGSSSDVVTYTSSATNQTIPNGSFTSSDSSLVCFSTSNSSTEFWDSGNNSTTSSLCSFDSSYLCPKLKSTTATILFYSTFAAGNMFSGTFDMGYTSGTAYFGQSFDWLARPQSLDLSYMATVGSNDKTRVFIAIVDWDSRHGVTAGTSDTTGIWDPETQTYVDEGDIIGYGSVTMDLSTSSFADISIPIYYYDKVTKPSDNYTIVISCAASYRGDYKEGSDDSTLWVDDFKFGY